jgi:hypothetical protein
LTHAYAPRPRMGELDVVDGTVVDAGEWELSSPSSAQSTTTACRFDGIMMDDDTKPWNADRE